MRELCGATSIDYIYGTEGIAGFIVDKDTNNEATYVYRKNIFGDVTAVYNDDGILQCTYEYDAWGNHVIYDADGKVVDGTGDNIGLINPIRYRGYYFDEETGLYYLKTRYYDPQVGRFMTIDGIEYLDPESINGLNLYAYCNNNPVMNVDPDGNKWWHWLLGGLAIIAMTAAVVTSIIATGGASLIAIGVGFAIGATSSVVAQGITNVINGNNFFHDIDILTVLISGLAGAAFATVINVAGAFGIGIAASVATSAAEEKSLKEILFDGLVGGFSASFAFGFGQFMSRVVYKTDDLVFTSFLEMAEVDGANVFRGAITAFAASWFKFIPSITPGVTRAILNFFWKKIKGKFND